MCGDTISKEKTKWNEIKIKKSQKHCCYRISFDCIQVNKKGQSKTYASQNLCSMRVLKNMKNNCNKI